MSVQRKTLMRIEDEILPLYDWSLDWGIPLNILKLRLLAGFTPEESIAEISQSDLKDLQAYEKYLNDLANQRGEDRSIVYECHGLRLSLIEWAIKLDFKKLVLASRLHNPCNNFDKVFTQNTHGRIEFDGRMQTAAEWASEFGVTVTTIYTRRNSGRPLDQSEIRIGIAPKKFEFNGQSLTLKEWSIETGITVGTLQSRMGQLSWSIEEALTTPVGKERKTKLTTSNTPAKVEYDGRSLTYEEWSIETGIPVNTLKSRINKLSWSIKAALTTPFVKERKSLNSKDKLEAAKQVTNKSEIETIDFETENIAQGLADAFGVRSFSFGDKYDDYDGY